MQSGFLFLDECSHEPLDLMALTGVYIAADKYKAIRDDICKLCKDIQSPPENTVLLPLVFHARNLLQSDPPQPYETDENRLLVYRTMAEIVNKNKLFVYRITYTNRREFVANMPGCPNLYIHMYHSIVCMISQLLSRGLVIPVMDGIPSHPRNATGKQVPRVSPELIHSFAGNTRYWHQVNSYPFFQSSIPNLHNLGEPVFADSEHSTFLQLTDVISHLLLQKERHELNDMNHPISSYKQGILEVCDFLNPDLIFVERIKMKFGNLASK